MAPVPVGIEDCMGLIDVGATVKLSIGFEDVLVVMNELAGVVIETSVTVTVLVWDSVKLFVDVVVCIVISDISMD